MMDAKTASILRGLKESHPTAAPELQYRSPFELLVAVILSAQCTDKRVNQVTAELFKTHNTPKAFAEMEVEDLERRIHSCGFYHNKARHIISASQDILLRFGGEVPSSREELMTLAGVGRKTANVVYSVAFHGNAIAVDTHVFRVSNRLGLANASTPEAVERQLMQVLPEEEWSLAHHLLIFHGRRVCKSQKPDCAACKLRADCAYYSKVNKNEAL
ncbi:MAG: endonuclease III [Clostridia bacterium]|nr:endonuclease III [Clostridia bacterium]